MRAWLVLALVLPALGGCLDNVTDRLRATDVEAPRWSVGDWWTYRIESPMFGVEGEIRVVVANVTPNGYQLGYPTDADATLAMLFHMPALGPVTRELAYDVHEVRFEPFQWPLEAGKRWTTTWIAAEVLLEVEPTANGTWVANNSGQEEDAGLLYEIEYDPAAKAISRFTRTGLDGVVRQSLVLVANGTRHVGEVVVPTSAQVVLLESRSGGALGPGALPAPQVAFAPPAGVDTLLVGCIAGGQPGEYRVEILNANGTLCLAEARNAPGSTGFQVHAVEAPAEAEGWQARLVAAGQGSATAEVLAYGTRVVALGQSSA